MKKYYVIALFFALAIVAGGFAIQHALATDATINFASNGSETYQVLSNANPGNLTPTSGSAVVIPQKDPAWADAMSGSSWITYAHSPNVLSGPLNGTIVKFIKTVTVNGTPTGGSISVMADDSASVDVNGVRIITGTTNDSFAPHCASVGVSCHTPTTVSIPANILHAGINTIEVLVNQQMLGFPYQYSSFGANFKGYITATATSGGGCANGTTLSPQEFQAARPGGSGLINLNFFEVNASTGQARVSFMNNTDCAAPVSLASYKMYDRVLSHQVFYDGGVLTNIPAHSTQILTVNLPSCMAQIDLFYGTAPRQLLEGDLYSPPNVPFTVDYRFYQNNGTGFGDASGNFCTYPPLQLLVCSPSIQNVAVGQSVTVSASGGSGVFAWSAVGANPSTGNAQTFSTLFSTIGTKHITVTSGMQTALCTVNVAQVNTASQPLVQTLSAQNVQETSALVRGSVNPNGANTTYWFEYGQTTSLGVSTLSQSAGSGTSPISTSALLSGLLENTTYYYRVVAQNVHGISRGTILNFTTQVSPDTSSAPSVQTAAVTNVSQSGATLNGYVDPNNASTNYWFEFGQTTLLGASSSIQSTGSGDSSLTVSMQLLSLSQNTTYYYRIVAQNVRGISRGSILNFTTAIAQSQGSAPSVQTASAINISQNSATINGYVDPNNVATNYWFEYGQTISLGLSSSVQSAGFGDILSAVSSQLSSILENTTYYYRVVAQNSFGISRGSILSFTTSLSQNQGSAPTIETKSASNIIQNSATLNGRVTPNNSQTSYWFEYGTNANTLSNSSASQSVGAGSAELSAPASIYTLSQNTTYYYRIVAQNSYGISRGSVLNFTTQTNQDNDSSQPSVQTTSAISISQNSATLNGYVTPNGSQTTYWFEYGTNSSNMSSNTGSQSAGSGFTQLSANINVSGLSQNTTYYYRIVAQNNRGTSYGSTFNFTTQTGGGTTQSQPTVQTNYSNVLSQTSAMVSGQVTPNGTDAIAWFEYGTNSNFLGFTSNTFSAGNNYSAVSYSQTLTSLNPGTTYYFRAAARSTSLGNTVYGQTLSFTTTGNGGGTFGEIPSVFTDEVTVIGQNSALLNARVNTRSGTGTAWFEYGTSPSFNASVRSQLQPIGSSATFIPFSYAASGLTPGTTYYVRAVAQTQYGIAYGEIESFRTRSVVVVRPTPPPAPQPPVVVIPTPTIPTIITAGNALSCLGFVPKLDTDRLTPGQEVTYSISYRNGCPFDLQNAVLSITLPLEISFVSLNTPFFTQNGNTLTYTLGTVPREAQSTIYLKGVVKHGLNTGDSLLFGSLMTFIDSQGRLQSVSAYVVGTIIVGGVVLGASVSNFFANFFGGWFLWLLLLIVIALLIYMAFFKKGADERKRITVVS